jgi:hypothetical protein
MKKYISILLSLLVLFSLSACANNQAENKEPMTTIESNEPISTSKALESDNFEFIYNFKNIPESFWNEENSLKCKENFEGKVICADLKFGTQVFDFALDIDATNRSENDEYYELRLSNNNFLIPTNIEAFSETYNTVYMYVMDNNLDFHSLSLDMVDLNNSALSDVQLKDGEWVYRKTDDSYTTGIEYVYKINKDKCIVLHVGYLSKEIEDPYTEEHLKELGEYITSLVEIVKVDKKDFSSIYINESVDLGENYSLNLAAARIKSFALCDADGVGVPCFEFISENGDVLTFMEFDSEKSFNKWRGSSELEPYSEHVSLLKSDEQSSYNGYQGLHLKYGEKRYALCAFEPSSNISNKDEYVNSLMNDIIFENK